MRRSTLVEVSGAFELPQALAHCAARGQKFDGYIALGCVVRGETDHYEFICNSAMDGLMQVALRSGICLGTAVLTVDTLAQAVARSHETGANKGAEAAVACLKQIAIARQFAGYERAAPEPSRALPPCRRCIRPSRAGQSPETVIDQFVRHRIGDVPGAAGWMTGMLTEAHVPLFARIVRTATLQQDTIDGMLVAGPAGNLAAGADRPGIARA